MSQALANSYAYHPLRPKSSPQSQKRVSRNKLSSKQSSGPLGSINVHDYGKENDRDVAIPYSKFVFPDTRAIYQLNEIESFHDIVYNEVTIHGFEIYLVENWVAQRKLSSIITSLTGNVQDTIHGVEMVLPSDYTKWPPHLQKYYSELLTFGQPKFIERTQSTLFITNLATIPLSLHILHIENGNLKSVWPNFRVNFNLKALNCLGRSSNLLMEPSTACLEKFNHLFKFSSYHDNKKGVAIPTAQYNYGVIIDISQIVQIALHYYNRYNQKRDGLLCDYTKAAINNWWIDYGKLYFGMEKPKNESVLDPTTFSAVVSLTLAVYYKLTLENCMNTKHPFHNTDEFFLAIALFQRKVNCGQRDKKVYLDHMTLEKLFEATAKFNTNKDLLHLKRKVKSKMQDLTGKSNTARLSHEILATDLESLIFNLHDGDNDLTYLWRPSHNNKFISLSANTRDFTQFNFHHGDTDKEMQLRTEILDKSRMTKFVEPAKKQKSSFNMNNFVENKFTHDALNKPGINLSTSFMSISSMFPMYDNPTATFDDRNNQEYQREYFRRDSLPFINDGTRDIDDCSHNKVFFHRSNSQSNLAESLERWDLPFDASTVKIARDLKRIDIKLSSQERSVNEELGCTADMASDPIFLEYTKLSQDLQTEFDKYKENSNYFKDKSSMLSNKQELVDNDIAEINSLSAKLNYDVRILELRVRDVEDSIMQFESKICQVKKSLVGIEDEEFNEALTAIDDKPKFNACIKRLVEVESKAVCHNSIYTSLLKKSFFVEFKNDIMAWVHYFFAQI